MIIAQITDFHVRPPGVLAYGRIDTNAMLRNAVAAIASLDPGPDCVIATGDLADCGLHEEYQEIADAFAELPMPVFVIPGNHDRLCRAKYGTSSCPRLARTRADAMGARAARVRASRLSRRRRDGEPCRTYRRLRSGE